MTDFIKILLKYHSASQVCPNFFVTFSRKICAVLSGHRMGKIAAKSGLND